MPAQQVASGSSIPDRIALGALMRLLPPTLVDEVVAQHGRQEERKRLLPARVVVYFILAMTLFTESSYREVMRKLTEGLRERIARSASWSVPTRGSIAEARQRLGVPPIRALFDRVARPLAGPQTEGAWLRGRWRLTALDGSTVNVSDTPANEAAFGRPGHSRGERAAYPQVRLVALAECGTHAFLDFADGPGRTGETTMTRALLKSLQPNMLCLADRNFYSFSLWQEARATGADLLWRVKKDLILEPLKRLSDGSYLSTIYPSSRHRERGRGGVIVRVIEFTVDNGAQALTTYRVITSILDPEAASAGELAIVY
ncbi:MAG: IS4 family transposase, partial [Nitrososphaerales archaeon]